MVVGYGPERMRSIWMIQSESSGIRNSAKTIARARRAPGESTAGGACDRGMGRAGEISLAIPSYSSRPQRFPPFAREARKKLPPGELARRNLVGRCLTGQ